MIVTDPIGVSAEVMAQVRGFTPRTPERNERLGEALAVREIVRLPLLSPKLAMTNRGSDLPTVVLPGYSTNDTFLCPMRTYLSTRNHAMRGWGLGTNGGDVAGYVEQMTSQLDASGAADAPVALVGWSLGGVIAREVARDRPDMIRRVITFGTPLFGPRYTTASDAYSEDETSEIEQSIAERLSRPIEVPVTAIFSQRDSIVDWRTCVDQVQPDVEHIEVGSTHIGMTVDPDVWEVAANRLAIDG